MRRFTSVLSLFMGLGLVGSSHAQGVAPAKTALSYDEVIAAPEASIGKTVSWVGRFSSLFVDIAPGGGVTNVRTLFEHRDAGASERLNSRFGSSLRKRTACGSGWKCPNWKVVICE